jgi:TonB family protein
VTTSIATYALALALVTAPLRLAAGDEPVYDLSDDITPPRVTHMVNPAYSAHGVRVKGSVMLGLVVTAEGMPKDVHVVRGIAPEVDRSAVEALQQWRFSPAKKDGKPVAVRITLELQFHSM